MQALVEGERARRQCRLSPGRETQPVDRVATEEVLPGREEPLAADLPIGGSGSASGQIVVSLVRVDLALRD